MNALTKRVKKIVSNLEYFSCYAGGIRLRPYQLEAGDSVVRSVIARDGEIYVFMFSRQSGKDEDLTQIVSYLLTLFAHKEESIVIANPTFKPQTENAMQRLEARLTTNLITRGHWKRRSGYTYRIGQARALFFSGDPVANVVGSTASLLLIINEAQDIQSTIYDKRFAPMAAAHNAVRVFCGTAWTSDSLLARELAAARLKEQQDGKRRVFIVDADQVAACHAPYGVFVQGEIARLGRQHPLVKTQYFNETIDAQAGMFGPARRALMKGDRSSVDARLPGHVYSFLIDVAGQDEARMGLDDDAPLQNPGRDAVSLTIVDIDLSTLETLQAPTFRAVYRQQWIGQNHLKVFGALKSLGDSWDPQHLAIDATGVGEGLWALIDKSFPGKDRVLPVKFTQAEKSEIGWRFIAVIETGRFRDCCLTDAVRAQYDACRSEILPGPAKTLRWSVPEGARGPDGELIHDDYVLADSLVAVLDRLEWSISRPTSIIANPGNPLEELGRSF